ncbi:putative C-type lectin domain family 20 member A, partial [Centroberyx affinis]|uniref:putative C-type lectin domain family 20 member A n=1 Tax=Centroberyx affinis TaxID=166261 RepID=UPI003A5BC8CD
YHLVKEPKKWTEAQSHCREKYTDLATIDNEEDVAKLNDTIGKYYDRQVWIGLYDDINSWRWSLENESYSGERGAEARMSESIERDNTYIPKCVFVSQVGEWGEATCRRTMPFICYNGTTEARDSSTEARDSSTEARDSSTEARDSSIFVFVLEFKNWTEAQSYCREHYTDLAVVRNDADDEVIKMITRQYHAWIGLTRDSWKWSDGSATSFSNWDRKNNQPNGTIIESCAATTSGKWENSPCDQKSYFACYSVPVTKQVVRVKLTKTDSSVDLEELKEAILQQMNQRLKDQGLGGGVQLRWAKQPDGKVFHKEERKEDKEEKDEL